MSLLPTSASPSSLVFKQYSFASSTDIQQCASKPEFDQKLIEIAKLHYTVDLAIAMKNFTDIDKYLYIANLASYSHPCNQQAVEIYAKYQGFISKSHIAMNSFLNNCLAAIRKHKIAMTHAEKGNFKSALVCISQCAILAKSMSGEAKQLSTMSDELCKDSREALKAATKDKTSTIVKRDDIANRIEAAYSNEKYLQQLNTSLSEQLAEEKKLEEKVDKNINSMSRKAFAVKILRTAMTPVTVASSVFAAELASVLTTGLPTVGERKKKLFDKGFDASRQFLVNQFETNQKELETIESELRTKQDELEQARKENKDTSIISKEIKNLQDKKKSKAKLIENFRNDLQNIEDSFDKQTDALRKLRADITENRQKLQELERNSKADLAKTIQELTSMQIQKGSLSEAARALGLCAQALGRLSTYYNQLDRYFNGVATHCEQLTNIEDLTSTSELEEDTLFLETLYESAWNWLAFGRVSYMAKIEISNANDTIDSRMGALPVDDEEARKMLQSIRISMVEEIKPLELEDKQSS